ncbi:MAG: Asp-tRNA(Asn)/Glu-tRNA(Gln) amidotransferase subunit GatB [Candidatus Brocadiae bacterium]|nr:Asp-tRNA(Asn)/Glu-tRNA(Gln) amidotransferase subunit GatB [Candidatus Brocadiia bacterium]
MEEFDITIGLEVHVQLSTQTKLFCSCGTRFAQSPNSQVCPVCLGLPGSLPVLNQKALELGVKAALALNCTIPEKTKFDRKNYFYPDLPKGYQISQYDEPVSQNGFLVIPIQEGKKKIGIVRAHLEEDAGKLIHSDAGQAISYVDLNRAGVPLLEIVTAPDIESPEEAYCYLTELKKILQYIEVSDCNMQEGSLRCDANISLKPKGSKTLGTKTEIKNLNSFNFIRKALQYEANRQFQCLKRGERIEQATYTWLEKESRTEKMRSKEDAHDYHYFPEPDLPPFSLKESWVQGLQDSLPELPQNRLQRMMEKYGLNRSDAELVTQNRKEADYFEECAKNFQDYRELMNWIKGKVYTYLNEKNLSIAQFPVSPENLSELLQLVSNKKINREAGKEILDKMITSGQKASCFIQNKEKITDHKAIMEFCQKVLAQKPHLAEEYKAKPNVLNSIMGSVMKESQGRADAEKVKEILLQILG